MKKKIVTYLLVASMLTVASGCGNTVKETTTETGAEEALEETSVEASSEQSTEETAVPVAEKQNKPEINEDLLGAIEQLAICYDEFYSADVEDSSMWQPFFIDHFIRGNWDGYDYMKQIEKNNKGIITKDQVEYIQRSLTGIDISFDSMEEGQTIDVNDFVNSTDNTYGNITSYELIEDEMLDADTTYLNAQFEMGSLSSNIVQTYDMYVFLKENPDSCFGGYSIESFFKVEESSYEESDGQEQAVSGTEHSFYGWYSDEYLEGEWIWPQIDRSADDILEKFRASRPVKYPDSIYGEGDVLGRWAMATIGKNNIPEEVREKGRHIGAAHEYWFGTDIANNFSNNIPTMYGTYYALKDYYSSEGRNSAEFYQEMIDDCWESDPDKDATIKKMYESLKDVISDLNNLIRAQQ